jgi:hypothetical protein
VSIELLKTLCKCKLDDRLKPVLYKVLDELGIDKASVKKDERVELIEKYLKKRYKMGKGDRLCVLMFLKDKFRRKELEEVLGEYRESVG